MNFRTKNDIPFVKFLNFSEETEGIKDEDFVEDKIIDIFYNGNYRDKRRKVDNFLSALQTNGKLKMRYKLNLEALDKAGTFIDAEVFRGDKDVDSLLRLLVTKKHFWQKVNIDKLSIIEGEFILNSFLKGQMK